MLVDRNDLRRATVSVAWQELGALAVNAAAAHGSCFLWGHALRGYWISRMLTRDDQAGYMANRPKPQPRKDLAWNTTRKRATSAQDDGSSVIRLTACYAGRCC